MPLLAAVALLAVALAAVVALVRPGGEEQADPAPSPADEEPAAGPTPTPTPTPEPPDPVEPVGEPAVALSEDELPEAEPVDGELALYPPYSADSPWNTPIPPDAAVHERSEELAARLGEELTSDTSQYTLPVYEVTDDTPTVPVEVFGVFSDVGGHGTTMTREYERVVDVPIPEGAEPAPGTDNQIVVVNTDTGEEWGFWQLHIDEEGTHTATNGYRYNVRWSAVPPDGFGSRGAGVPYLAGLIRPEEIERGRIEHAIAVAYPTPSPEHVFPATKSDGGGEPELDLPEGARLRLDPTLGEDDFDALGLSEEARIIARALQEYGMILIDIAGRTKIYAEYEGTAGWEGAIVEDTVSALPMSALSVLDWEEVQWPPLAEPTARDEVPRGGVVTLDATSSYAPGGSVTAHLWTDEDGEPLAAPGHPLLRWHTGQADAGEHVFGLRVRDDGGVWSPPRAVPVDVVEADGPFVADTQEITQDAGDVLALPPWRPDEDDVLLVAVNLRRLNVDDEVAVEEVTGSGRSWRRVFREADERGAIALELWAAPAGPVEDEPVEVHLSDEANAAVQALRVTGGVELADAAVASTGEETTAEAAVTLPDVPEDALVLGFHAGRTEDFVPADDLEPNAVNTELDDGGSSLRLSSVARAPAADGAVELRGATRSPMDWIMGAVSLTR